MSSKSQETSRSLDYQSPVSAGSPKLLWPLRRIGIWRILFGVLLAAIGAWATGAILIYQTRPLTPPEIFSLNQRALREYIADIQAGKIAARPDGTYPAPAFFARTRGDSAILRSGNCIVIITFYSPLDSVDELWYSPAGFSPLPQAVADRKRHRYFVWKPLAPDWGFCQWDD